VDEEVLWAWVGLSVPWRGSFAREFVDTDADAGPGVSAMTESLEPVAFFLDWDSFCVAERGPPRGLGLFAADADAAALRVVATGKLASALREVRLAIEDVEERLALGEADADDENIEAETETEADAEEPADARLFLVLPSAKGESA
jgi:hypothetical protein